MSVIAIMVQSFKKGSVVRNVAKSNNSSAKMKKKQQKSKQAKLGSSLKLPKNQWRNEALDDRALSKAIAKASEAKVAAKLFQGGGRIGLSDITQKGKELNKEMRRNQVKKKLTKVEEKLKILQENQAIVDDTV